MSSKQKDCKHPVDKLCFRDFGLHLYLAQERERQRIAIGMHDQIGQNLAIASAALDKLAISVAPGQDVEQVEEISTLIEQTIQAVRALTFDLASPVFYLLGLGAAIRSLGDKLERDQGIHFDFASDETVIPLPKEANIIIYRCASQLLRNIGEHAHAKHISVRITVEREEMHIVIIDDGVGFERSGADTDLTSDNGFGLYSIAEQMEFIGGRLDIHAAPNAGTRARLIVPYDRTRVAP